MIYGWGEVGSIAYLHGRRLALTLILGFDDYDDDMIIPTQCSIISSRLAACVIENAFEFKRGIGLEV
jgi:hypothetical protein